VKEFTSEAPAMLQPYIPLLLVVAFVVANAILMLGCRMCCRRIV
jgi:hypothetical protein